MQKLLAPRAWFIISFGTLSFSAQSPMISQLFAQQASSTTDLKERFLKEAPSAWEEYSGRAEKLQGKTSFQMTIKSQEGKIEHHYEFKMNGESKLFYMTKERQIKGTRDYHTFWVYGINPKYTFGLTRKTESSPWVVSELIVDNPDPEKSFEKQFEMKPALAHLVRIQEQPLSDIIRKPSFRLVGCRALQQNRVQLAEVIFDCPEEPKEGQLALLQGGRLILDPNAFWSIRVYQVRQKLFGGHQTIDFQVSDLTEIDKSLVLPKRALARYEKTMDDGTATKWESLYEYDLSFPNRLPSKDDFTLSAFGLSEPPGLAKSWRWYLLAAFIGFLCLALGAFACLKARGAKPVVN
jgi:hypothetical protein